MTQIEMAVERIYDTNVYSNWDIYAESGFMVKTKETKRFALGQILCVTTLWKNKTKIYH